jgi:predicted O-linked N-acetylglucosamine transferase (SPINDLY family)
LTQAASPAALAAELAAELAAQRAAQRAAPLDTLVAQAQAALQANDSAAALAASRAALRMQPDHEPALGAAWHASMLAQRWDWAAVVGERWCRVHPQQLAAWQACLVPQLLLHQTERFVTTLRNARQSLGPHELLSTLEALLLALVGDDTGSAAAAAQVAEPALQRCAETLLGASFATLLSAGWQPALLRAFLLYEQQMAGVWAGRERLAPTLQELVALPCIAWPQLRFVSLTYAASEDTQIALVNRMADAWPAAGPVRAARSAARSPTTSATTNAATSGRLRVAYLSPCLGAHATMVMMCGLPREQDHTRFEIFAYGHAPGRQVEPSELLVQGCDVQRGLPQDAAQAAAIIARDQIDVLIVMPDWEMDWVASVCRASGVPVIIHHLTSCGSTGGLAHYRIVDDSFVPSTPPAREATIHLRGSCYTYSGRAAPPATRHAHGLPEGAVVLAAFNAAYKIGPDLAAVWARLLQQVPEAMLWLHQTHGLQAVQLRAWFAAQGIGPERLVFAANAAHPEHLARTALADLYLDAWDYNGHTSILDALFAGVPVVTRQGPRIAQRMGANLLRQHGARDWVAHSAEEYERLALTLVQSADARRAYRAQLAQSRAGFVPFQLATQARRFDAAVSAAYARYEQGLAPADITID